MGGGWRDARGGRARSGRQLEKNRVGLVEQINCLISRAEILTTPNKSQFITTPTDNPTHSMKLALLSATLALSSALHLSKPTAAVGAISKSASCFMRADLAEVRGGATASDTSMVRVQALVAT